MTINYPGKEPSFTMKPSVPAVTRCKCCKATARLFDVCDLNKNCEERNGLFLDLSGIPIYYYRCSQCGFIFTEAFDNLDQSEFSSLIYNSDYLRVDPDYATERPNLLAQLITNTFINSRDAIKVLDYGGGNGGLAQRLIENGFNQVSVYDPFTPEFAQKPSEKFHLILAFEVVEHVPDLYETFSHITDLLDPQRGFITMSTVLQPPEIDRLKGGWWYIAPRNGHISIHTLQSLQTVINSFGLKLVSTDQSIHCAFRQIPDFAQHIFKSD